MKNSCLFLYIFVISLFCAGCSDDNKHPEVGSSTAIFSQNIVSASLSGGVVTAIVEWSGTEWQIDLDVDNGIIEDITPKTGGNSEDKGLTQVKFYCKENTTGTIRTRDIYAVYGKTTVGYNNSLPLMGNILVEFGSIISSSKEGETHYLALNNANNAQIGPVNTHIVRIKKN
jgi:hypothetical protein